MRGSRGYQALCIAIVGGLWSCGGDEQSGAADEDDVPPLQVDGGGPDQDGAAVRDADFSDRVGADAGDAGEVIAAMVLGESGGTVASSDGTARLEIPAGALKTTSMVSIRTAVGAPSGAIGTAFDLGPDAMTFEEPVVLSLTIPLGTVGALNPDAVTIGTVVAGKWQPAPLVFLDAAAGKIHALIGHFSIWAIIPRPTTPCLVDVECSRECCAGVHAGDERSTTCVYSGVLKYDDCYAACVGSAEARNYSSPCLRECCVGNRGELSQSGACVLQSDADVALTLACSRGCFGPAEPITICFGTRTATGKQGGWCTPCAETCSAANCRSGTEEADFPSGTCVASGSGCSTCIGSCGTTEDCGNDVDDNCNGQIDEGCVRCTSSARCAVGMECYEGYCVRCREIDARERCGAPGGGCTVVVAEEDVTYQGTCVARGNGCGNECRGSCREREECGNGYDDDCDGAIDNGCAARLCNRSSQCAVGSECQNGYCTPCSETCAAASCGRAMPERDMPYAGTCAAYGNGCSTCLRPCDTREQCGNDVDDNCNGQIDEGCAACTSSGQCAIGLECYDGYCVPCREIDARRRCGAPGGGCTLLFLEENVTYQGTCVAHGNGCGNECRDGCQEREVCGNQYDDDCNGLVDDGCSERSCTLSAACAPGQECVRTGSL